MKLQKTSFLSSLNQFFFTCSARDTDLSGRALHYVFHVASFLDTRLTFWLVQNVNHLCLVLDAFQFIINTEKGKKKFCDKKWHDTFSILLKKLVKILLKKLITTSCSIYSNYQFIKMAFLKELFLTNEIELPFHLIVCSPNVVLWYSK